jgi:hypothetical protein
MRATGSAVPCEIEYLRKEVAKLSEHEKDLLFPCPARGCEVAVGKKCRGLLAGHVHFARRLKRLLGLHRLNEPTRLT